MAKFAQNIIFVSIPGIFAPIALRTHTCDYGIYGQIYESGDYNFLPRNFSPNLIIDGGANIGLSVAFFAHIYPNAKIYAVEPEKSNFDILKYNTYFYQNVELLQKGIWNKDTNLLVKDIGLGKCGFIVEETEETGENIIEAVTISSLLEKSGMQQIDILKLDIEGAEKEVFTSNYESWIGKVGILIIELHERMKQGCEDAFVKAIRDHNFERFYSGENIVLINRKKFPDI